MALFKMEKVLMVLIIVANDIDALKQSSKCRQVQAECKCDESYCGTLDTEKLISGSEFV